MKYLLYSICITLLFSSCSSNGGDDAPSQNPNAGAISGTVFLHDAFGIPTSNDGMTVRITGRSSSATTDENGGFTFPNVPLGNFELVFEKDGFGTFKTQVEHTKNFDAGSTELLPLYLGEKSSTAITNGNVSFENNVLEISFSTLPNGTATRPVYATAFLGKDAAVSNLLNIGVISPDGFNSGATTVSITATLQDLQGIGFTSGETLHFKVYGDSFQTNAYRTENGIVHPNANDTQSSVYISGSIELQ